MLHQNQKTSETPSQENQRQLTQRYGCCRTQIDDAYMMQKQSKCTMAMHNIHRSSENNRRQSIGTLVSAQAHV